MILTASQQLRDYDERSFNERFERLQFLDRLMRRDVRWGMPVLAYHYFQDAKICFIGGAPAATVVMCQMVAEEVVRAAYRESGNRKLVKRAGLKELLNKAHEDRLVSNREFRDLNRLRGIRNPYVHTGNDLGSQITKWMPTDLTTKVDVVRAERDARTAFKILVRFLDETSLIMRL